MHFLRQLNKFGISQIILKQFYYAVIKNVLTFSITVWFDHASFKEKAQLETHAKCASKIGRERKEGGREAYRERLWSGGEHGVREGVLEGGTEVGR